MKQEAQTMETQSVTSQKKAERVESKQAVAEKGQNRPAEMAIKDLVRKAKFEKQGVSCV